MPYLYLNLQNESLQKQQRVFYTDSLKGKHVLIFVHGWFGQSSDFSFYLNELQNDYRVISFDLPGHGKSSHEKNKLYSHVTAYRALKHLASAFAQDSHSLTLVGFSLGAFLTMKLSLLEPKWVDQLILISPVFDLKPLKESSHFIKKKNIFLSCQLLFRSLVLSFPFEHPRQNYSLLQRLSHFRVVKKNHPLYCMRSYARSLDDSNLESLIRNNNKPTLLLHGTNDSIHAQEEMATYSRNMSYSKLLSVQGQPHNMLLTAQKEILTATKEFLKTGHKRKYGWLKIFSKENKEDDIKN